MTDFVGRADLAIFLGIELAAIEAARADLALAAAQASVRSYLDQELTLVSGDVVLLHGSGNSRLRLPQRPVRSVSLVEEGDGVTFEAVDAADYVLRNDILYRIGAEWPPEFISVRVTYTHGYDAGAVDSDSDSDYDANHIPADITLVTLSVARRIYDASGATPTDHTLTSERIGNYAYTRAADAAGAGSGELIGAEKIVLDRYRVTGVR